MNVCPVCGKSISAFSGNAVKGKSGQWVCKECLKKANVGVFKFSNTFITSDQIKSLIDAQNVETTSANLQTPKKKKSRLPLVLIVVVCMFAFAATMGILFGEEEPSNEQNNSYTESQIEYIEISANELYAEFEANEVAADEKYKGKYVKVTGIVTEISSGGTFTQACILLNVEDSIIFGDVQCNFNNDESKKIAELTKGQTVTVAGLCSGLGTINLDINNCEIVGD